MHMKNITPYMYLAGSLLIPMVSLAHGDGDGHDEVVDVAHPENRMIVLAVVVGVFLLMGIFVLYSRSKSAPAASAPEKKDGASPS